jgi:hypothetical protein
MGAFSCVGSPCNKIDLVYFISIKTEISKSKMASCKKIAPLREKYIPQAEPEKLLLPLCPVNCIGVDNKLDLIHELKKRDSDEIGSIRGNSHPLP